jgi:hypothetical protein
MGYGIEFYKTESGREPVAEFIKSLPDKQTAKMLRDIRLLKELGGALYFPYVDFVKGEKYRGLMELRTKQGTNIFRTFYFVVVKNPAEKTETAILLHAIQKKDAENSKKGTRCGFVENERIQIKEEL